LRRLAVGTLFYGTTAAVLMPPEQPLHALAHLVQLGCHGVGKEELAQLRVGRRAAVHLR
jgi:hypothetical protein